MVVKTSKELKDERALKMDAQEELIDTRKKEERAFTDEETKSFNDLQSEIVALNAEITQRETEEAVEARKAKRDGDRGPEANNGFSEGEQRDLQKYDFFKLIRSQQGAATLDGLEKEVHEDAVKEARESNKTIQGVGISNSVAAFLVKRSNGTLTEEEKRTLSAGTNADGGFTVQDDAYGSLLTALQPQLVTAQAGAQTWGGLTGDVPIDSLGSVSVGWKTENANADNSEPTFSQSTLTPKRCTAYADVSNQLLVQSSFNIQNEVLRAFFQAIAAEVDSVALTGGGANQPIGILSASGIGNVAGGTNGLAPTYSHILSLEEVVSTANADMGSLSYVSNTKVRRVLKSTKIDAGSGLMVWAGKEVNGYPAYTTTNVPSNLVKGSGTDLSAIIYGNFRDLIIAQWGGVDIVVDNVTQALGNKTRLVIHNLMDVGLLRTASFAAMKDAIA